MTFWLLAGTAPADLGVIDGRLADCPASPNCVCSDCSSRAHRVDALALRSVGRGAQAQQTWEKILDVLATLPRTQVMSATNDYAHAECRSRLLGFVDDLELHFRPRQNEVAVRSASRLGYSDLGANRARVEALREALRSAGLVK